MLVRDALPIKANINLNEPYSTYIDDNQEWGI